MNYLIITRGPAGCGKSTWIKNEGLEPYTIEADKIRLLFQSPSLTVDGSYTITPKNDNRVWKLIEELVEARMERGELVVIDATFSSPKMISQFKKLIDSYRYRVICIDFSDVPLDVILEQNRERANVDSYKFVPQEAIEKHYARIQSFDMPKYVKTIKPYQFRDTIERKTTDYTDKYDEIVFIGDIHSCYDPLHEYFEQYPESEHKLYIQLGDLFDRGPQPKEVAQWLVEHYEKNNWIFLQSNHNIHLTNWAFEQNVKSNEFKFNTAPTLFEIGDLSLWRQVARKFNQIAYFEFGELLILASHGPVPRMFAPDEFAFIASQEFYKGVGKYEQTDEVANTWNKQSSSNEHLWHGHSGNRPEISLGNVHNLNGEVEFGGHLKISHLNKFGDIVHITIKNDRIRANLRHPREQNIPDQLNFSDNMATVERLRADKNIRENRMGIYSSFNFKNKVFYDKSWNELRETARGLFINNMTNEVVARGWKKYFNLHERTETQLSHLKENLVFPCKAYHKYNGFLGLLGYDSQMKQLLFCTKSSTNNDFSANFERIFRMYYEENIDEITKYLAENNKCMAFEVIDPVNDPHIVKYHVEQVVLLDIFDRSFTMNKLPHLELSEIADKFTLTSKWMNSFFNSWDSLESWIRFTENNFENLSEGYVIEDSSGFAFKLKTPYYNFWKKMRGMLFDLAKGRQVKYNKLVEPLACEFIGWASKLDRKELQNLGIIDARDKFYKEK